MRLHWPVAGSYSSVWGLSVRSGADEQTAAHGTWWWRLNVVRRRAGFRARAEPQRVAETAGSMIGEVVGRDATCVAIIGDLREEAALQYLWCGRPSEDEHFLRWLVQTAGVAETPFYLEIARQLQQAGLIDGVMPRRDRLPAPNPESLLP